MSYRYPTKGNLDKYIGDSTIVFSETVLEETAITDGTVTTVDLRSGDRKQQGLRIYNRSADTAVEFVFGGPQLTTLTGDTPISTDGTVHTVSVTTILGFRVGQVIDITDTTNSDALILRGEVSSVLDGDGNPTTHQLSEAGSIVLNEIEKNGTPASTGASGDKIGLRYFLAATWGSGEGHVVFQNTCTDLVWTNERYIHVRRLGTGTANARIVASL